MKTRRICLIVCTLLLIATECISLFGYYHDYFNPSPWCYYFGLFISLLCLFLLIYGIDFNICIKSRRKKKEDCPFIDNSECPYNSISQCPYNTSFCQVFSTNSKASLRTYTLWFLLFVAIIIYCASVLGYINKWDEIVSNICISLISAILVAFLIDLPGKMKEYQGYFVNLLSSTEYLKQLDDAGLSKLRKQTTWVLHAKEYPNMPRALIELDERICNMLKEPYFKEFSQIITVSKNDIGITKHNVVEYIIQNPGQDSKYISADIGLSNSVRFSHDAINDDSKLLEEAKRTIKIKTFIAYIDDKRTAYDLKSQIQILVLKGKNDNSDYNGEIHIAPLSEQSNKSDPLSIKNLTENSREKIHEELNIKIGKEDDISLYIQFKKKVVIKLEYDIIVPEDDKCFSKRLRYPVKYFNLDYSLEDGFDDVTLSGQLIGTLIDQKDISFYQSENKRKLSFKTHNWLLPKNGVFIVHSK